VTVLSDPQDVIAQDFMTRKGYPDAEPIQIEREPGSYCWYYTYELEEGDLDLEVQWLANESRWVATVTDFRLFDA
jgi:hypothetical protein